MEESRICLYSDTFKIKDGIAKSSLIAVHELCCAMNTRLKLVYGISSSKCKDCNSIITKFIFQCMIFVIIQRSIRKSSCVPYKNAVVGESIV